MIELHDVTKRYGRVTALNCVSFTAPPGRVTALLGPNASGKSSALRIITGIDRPDSGSARIAGQPYRDLSEPLRTVGTSFGGSGAHPSRTGRTHLRWLALSNRIPRGRIAEVLEAVELSHAAKKQTGDYSLGMAQRLGIAAALLGDPSVLILDEPVNGLDADAIRWFRRFIRDYADAGNTVLLSSHFMAETAAIADEVVILHRGRVAKSGSVREVSRGHASLEAAYFSLVQKPRRPREQ